jgi:hypothetical protein
MIVSHKFIVHGVWCISSSTLYLSIVILHFSLDIYWIHNFLEVKFVTSNLIEVLKVLKILLDIDSPLSQYFQEEWNVV